MKTSLPYGTVSFENGTDFNNILSKEESISGGKGRSLQELLNASEVDLSAELQPPVACVEIIGAGISYSPLCTLGNFSLVIGKAKSRKTFLVGVILAATLGKQLEEFGIRANLPQEQGAILYFDTEQSFYHVQNAAKRVLAMSSSVASLDFHVYGLRKYTPSERLSMIDHAINNTANLGFVVIDGIRDLVTSINDEAEATKVASMLLKWTEEKNIHIVCVLHQNKGDNNARGHLGTELQNKAENVVSVTKREHLSIVAAEYCREIGFEPFAFEINGQGIPQPVPDWSVSQGGKKSKRSIEPAELQPELHREALSMVFTKECRLGYTDLYSGIQAAMEALGKPIGANKAKVFVTYYLKENLISKEGVEGCRNAYYVYNTKTD